MSSGYVGVKPKRKKLTNIQLVKLFMERSGPMAQLFVMDALLKHAEAVAKSTPADYPVNSFVHPDAWIATAKEFLELLNER